jgi:outer membrane receptor protein involved in Fe transport
LEFGHFDLAGGELLYAIDARYHSRIVSSISETAPIVPPFHMLDTRLTYTRSHVLGTLYVNNLTNTLGINAITDPLFWGNRTSAVISQPRTIGLTLGYSFKGY